MQGASTEQGAVMIKKTLLTLLLILALAIPSSATMLWDNGWEDYSIPQDQITNDSTYDAEHDPYWWRSFVTNNESPYSNYIQITDAYASEGGNSLLTHWDNERRAMIYIYDPTDSGELIKFLDGSEHWVSFSMYLPSDWVEEDATNEYDIFFQLHDTSYNVYPEISLRGVLDTWVVQILADDDNPPDSYDRNVTYNTGNTPLLGNLSDDNGKWTNWIFHIKTDMDPAGGGGGYVDVYKDGVLVIEDSGGNAFLEATGPFVNVGLYKYNGTSGKTLYFDDIKIGDGDETLATMSNYMTDFTPSNGATGQSITVDGNWTNPTGTNSNTIYLDMKAIHDPPTTELHSGTAVETHDFGTLENDTEYAWRNDIVHAGGTQTGVVYYFTTASGPPNNLGSSASMEYPGRASD